MLNTMQKVSSRRLPHLFRPRRGFAFSVFSVAFFIQRTFAGGVGEGEIEEVDCACAVHDVDCYVANLAEAVGAFVETHQLGDLCCCGGTELSW